MIALLATGALALAGASTDPVPAPALTERPLDWALAGVGRGARSLVVQPGISGGCDSGDPIVRVRETPEGLDVGVSILSAQGPDVACPAIAYFNEPQTVVLDAPVAGRPVHGPERVTKPGYALLARAPAAGGLLMPRVRGLSLADARMVLCTWSIRGRSARRGGTVARQRPHGGTTMAAPAWPAPERCADLPARPAARLVAR